MLPSASVDPAPENVTASGTVPEVGSAVMQATGGLLAAAATEITTLTWPVFPALSLTVSVAVYVPAALYVCLGATSLLVPPSPNDHA